MAEPRRFLMMAGGTGGHVFPALATARALQASGHQVFWLGAVGGMEQRLIADTDIEMSLIHITGLRGKGKLALLTAPFKLMRSLGEAYLIVRRIRPHCALGMGGFVSGPGGVAARLTGTPLVIHEQNAVAGMTNRLLVRFAETVLEGFAGSFDTKIVTRCTGNPVRSDFAALEAPEKRLAQRSGPLRLLVVGGSLGAQIFNQQVPLALAQMASELRPLVRHQCGESHAETTRDAYIAAAVEVSVEPFITDMAAAFAWADLVLCRAGALTVAELCAAGSAAILVPFPHAADDHQTRNGEHMASAGAALLIPQAGLTPDLLADILGNLANNRERILIMSQAARKLARIDATEKVVNYCLEAADG